MSTSATSAPRCPLTRPGSPLTSPARSTSLLSPVPRVPRLNSPGPGSNLSFVTAPSTLSSASPSFKSTNSSLSKDFFVHLLDPTLYHPLPILDIPPPFRNPTLPDPSTINALITTGHFRSAAILAATQLTAQPGPSNPHEIFSLFYIRLSSLVLCNQTSLAAQEAKALQDPNAAHFRDPETDEHLCPWELRVLAVRLQGMGFNDARRGVMGYYDLARDARSALAALKKQQIAKPSDATNADIKLWTGRLEDLGVRVASALVEMEDLPGAILHLSSLHTSSPAISQHKALLYLHLGDTDSARACLLSTSEDPPDAEKKSSSEERLPNELDEPSEEANYGLSGPSPNSSPSSAENNLVISALLSMANNECDAAAATWDSLISNYPTSVQRPLYRQNLAVTLLYLGRGDEARDILTALLGGGPSNQAPHTFHALTFNLSTIYELCTERSRALKIALAERVAGLDAADDERTRLAGWERVNGDFKL